MSEHANVAPLRKIGLKVRHYKCFGDEFVGFDTILPINLIIGRNNSGKSSLLDVIARVVAPVSAARADDAANVALTHAEVYVDCEFTEDIIKRTAGIPQTSSITPGSYPSIAVPKIGTRLQWQPSLYAAETVPPSGQTRRPPTANDRFRLVQVQPIFGFPQFDERLPDIVFPMVEPLGRISIVRLSPGRDIRPEISHARQTIDSNGEGVTALLSQWLTRSYHDTTVVEEVMLSDINRVFFPDGLFVGIRTFQHDDETRDGKWEIHLREEGRDWIPLSQSGDGLKTVVLVMCLLHLLPTVENKGVENYFFAFEELENNLHPALLRRLLNHLRDFGVTRRTHFFLTTHSNVAIDLFANDDMAQIIHLQRRNGGSTTSRTASTYLHHKSIMEDLDVRASDLLQANAIVWVEGPSDRIYFNRWIELVSNGKVKEGGHYVCVQYGGGLLSGMTATTPLASASQIADDDDEDSALEPTQEEVNQLVNLLRVNRNAIVLMDRDRADADAAIKPHMARIRAEVEEHGGVAWIAAGREIENYLPQAALQRLAAEIGLAEVDGIEPFEEVEDYLRRTGRWRGIPASRPKVRLAKAVAPFIQRADLTSCLDLLDRVAAVYDKIRQWNSLPLT